MSGPRVSRRRLLGGGAAGLAAVLLAAEVVARREGGGLMDRGRGRQADGGAAREGRLLARPGQQAGVAEPGLHPLGLDGPRDGLLYVPPGSDPGQPAPFALLLHGAGGNARHGLDPLLPLADEAGLVLLAPDARRQTWDVLTGGYGPDVAFIDRALAQTFDRCAVDPARLAVGGFSDGASYALSLGITNGALFTHVLAFSPGFAAPAGQQDSPRLFISHGTRDEVLPIDYCSRRIVPAMQRAGFDVLYREFDGPHTVPTAIAREARDWFLTGRG